MTNKITLTSESFYFTPEFLEEMLKTSFKEAWEKFTSTEGLSVFKKETENVNLKKLLQDILKRT